MPDLRCVPCLAIPFRSRKGARDGSLRAPERFATVPIWRSAFRLSSSATPLRTDACSAGQRQARDPVRASPADAVRASACRSESSRGARGWPGGGFRRAVTSVRAPRARVRRRRRRAARRAPRRRSPPRPAAPAACAAPSPPGCGGDCDSTVEAISTDGRPCRTTPPRSGTASSPRRGRGYWWWERVNSDTAAGEAAVIAA